MSERRRRRRIHGTSSLGSSRTQALWIAGAVALVLAVGFVYFVVSIAYSSAGRKGTDSNLKAGIITLPNTAVPAADGPVAPIIITEANRDAADAQKPAAGNNWVEDIGVAGIVILVLMLGGSTVGLWMQIRQLAKTAERQLRETERAFLHIDIDPPEEAIARDGTPFVRIPIRCINNGRTPTRYGLGHASWHYFDEGGPESLSFNDLSTHHGSKPSAIAIGPKIAIGLVAIEIPQSEILKTPGSVFCWGWVDYNDIFEDSPRHRTEFCFEIARVEHGGKTELGYRNHRLHNGYDGECFRPPALYARSST